MNYLEENLKESEVKLVQAIYNSKDNLIEIINRVNTENFINEDMKKLFGYALILYQKYSFQSLSLERIKQAISLDEEIGDTIKELLKINAEIMMVDYNLDVKGEFEIYSKNLGLYKYHKFIENNGGIENLFLKMSTVSENTDDIRDFLLDNIDKCFSIYKSRPLESNLEDGMEELIKEINEDKQELGIRQKFNQYTDHFTGGIFKGVHFLGATSGMGKTTWNFPFYILPLLLSKDENNQMNEKILIIANEQDKKTFQKMFLVAIYSYIYRNVKENSKLNNRFIHRHRLERGTSTDLDKKLINDTYNFYIKNFRKRVKFVFMPMFNKEDIETCILSNARRGYKNIILDTLKAEQKGEYQLLSNLATRLDMIAKANDLRIIATVQLAIYTMNRKYLDHTCLAESKQIVEIAEHSLYFRYTDEEEISSLTVNKYTDIISDGKVIDVSIEQIVPSDIQSMLAKGRENNPDLFRNMKLMLVFVGKNRHGESNKVILAMMNFDTMFYKEIGVVEGLKYDKL